MKEEGTVTVAVAVLICSHFCVSTNALCHDSRGRLPDCTFEVELRIFKGPLVHGGEANTRIVLGSARIREALRKPRTLVKLQWSFSDGEEIRNATDMFQNPGEVGGHPKPVTFVAFHLGATQNVTLSSFIGEADREPIYFVAYKRLFAASSDTVGIPIDVMVNDLPCPMEEDHERPLYGDLDEPSRNWCWSDEGGEVRCGARASFCCSNTAARTKEKTFEHEHDSPFLLLLITLALVISFLSALVVVAGCAWRRRDQRVDSSRNSRPPSTAEGRRNASPSDDLALHIDEPVARRNTDETSLMIRAAIKEIIAKIEECLSRKFGWVRDRPRRAEASRDSDAQQ